jgi:hypothetical protein
MRKFLIATFSVLFFTALFSAVSPAQAAEIFFGAKTKEVPVGSQAEIGVFANTDGEELNAVGGDIVFPADIFDVQGINDGGSAMSLWVKRPAASAPGTVTFAGITPGGLNGGKIYLFSLVLKAKQKGLATIMSKNEQILLNDGRGSAAPLSRAPLSMNVTDAGSPVAIPPLVDRTPPEPFILQAAKSPDIFDGKWFVAFAAQDKGAGIDYYEVREAAPRFSFASLLFWRGWARAESPYLLKDQSRASGVEVKAVDRAGNQRIAALAPAERLPWYANCLFWITIVLLSGAAYWYWSFVKKQKAI